MEGIEMDVRLKTFWCHRGGHTIDAACGRDETLQIVFSGFRETICNTNSGVCKE